MFSLKTFGQIVVFNTGTENFAATVMILDETYASVTGIKNQKTIEVVFWDSRQCSVGRTNFWLIATAVDLMNRLISMIHHDRNGIITLFFLVFMRGGCVLVPVGSVSKNGQCGTMKLAHFCHLDMMRDEFCSIIKKIKKF